MGIETWRIPFEAYRGDDPYLFVSYSHKDRQPVFDDLIALDRHGFRLWYDEGIEPGSEWADEIARALERCTAFIVFISDRAIQSENVKDEIHYALNHRKACYAVYIEDTRLPPGLELRTGRFQAVMRFRRPLDEYRKVLMESIASSGRVQLSATETHKVPHPLGRGELEAAERRIAALHRSESWQEIRSVGPGLADAVLSDAKQTSAAHSKSVRLMHLGVYLTDADSTLAARRCLEAAVQGWLDLAATQGESVAVMDHLGMAYNNVGRLFRRHSPASRSAETYYRKSLELFRLLYPAMSEDQDLGDRLGMACVNLGNSLMAQEKPQAARDAYAEAVEVYRLLCAGTPADGRLERKLNEARARASPQAEAPD